LTPIATCATWIRFTSDWGFREAGGRRQEAGGRRQEAGGRRQEAGDRRQELEQRYSMAKNPVSSSLH